MVHARLICSDDDCTAVFEAYGSLEEIEALACDCGCGLEVVGWADALDDAPLSVELVELAA